MKAHTVPNGTRTVNTDYSVASIKYAGCSVHSTEYIVWTTKYTVITAAYTVHTVCHLEYFAIYGESRVRLFREKEPMHIYRHVRRVFVHQHECRRVVNATDIFLLTSQHPTLTKSSFITKQFPEIKWALASRS